MSGEEMIYKDSGCGRIPGVTRGTLEVKLEVLGCAALSDRRVPVLEIVFVDDLLEPVVLMNQYLHVCPNLAL
jgi:hypothetical protein